MADPGICIGVGADPTGLHQHKILIKFLKNCIKSRKFLDVGARAGGAPLEPPLQVHLLLEKSTDSFVI